MKLTRIQIERINFTWGENIFKKGDLEKEVKKEFESEKTERPNKTLEEVIG